MMFNVKPVTSNQTGMHPRLNDYVLKHLMTTYQRPENHLQKEIKTQLTPLVKEHSRIILDTGCGKGESSLHLAQQFPNHLILALDKSAHRLSTLNTTKPENVIAFRTNLIDFWLVAHKNNWVFEKTYVLYPNPWPKSEQARRRWHMHAIFPALLTCTKMIILRSNWLIYMQEFAHALELVTKKEVEIQIYSPHPPITAFERKYALDQQTLYQLELQSHLPLLSSIKSPDTE